MNFLGLYSLFSISPFALWFPLSFVPGELPTANTTSPAVTTPAPTVQPHSCPDGEFVCGAHNECVARSKVCDFRWDCSDGSDESNCGKTLIRINIENFHYCILMFSQLPSLFSSEGTVRFWRRWRLWLEERRLFSGANSRISLVTRPRGEHSWWRAVPPSY